MRFARGQGKPPCFELCHQIGKLTHCRYRGLASEGPLAELDQILKECNDTFPEAVDQSHNRHDDKRPSAADVKKIEKNPTPNVASTTSSEIDIPLTTSTLKAGVGYETGTRTADAGSSIEKNMCGAAKRQRELDDLCLTLINRLNGFIRHFNGLVSHVLLALKMSPGFNRLMFSLLLNDSLLDWGKRRELYDAVLDLLDAFSSQFYVGVLLHDLLEGDGTHYNGSSNCQALLAIVHAKAVIISQQKLANFSASEEGSLAKNTTTVCRKIILTHQTINEAIKSGRETGIISNPNHELTSKDMRARHPHLPGADDEDKPPPTEQEDIAAYIKQMKKHRLRYVALVEAARGVDQYRYLGEVTRSATSGTVKKNRMVRIATEIAGLSTDLPCGWSSGIYTRVDYDRPDILKSCIMAPEGTPYENGCFEFDIYLPLTYPDTPPKVNLCTTAHNTVRFNPNIYNDGKVCLSLLGTWTGPGWLPDTSSLLQVLLSIQSLIFVPDPYFNEPGYSASQESQQKQSKQYDRQIRAATLKFAILGQMKKPSPLFSDCINDHFRLKKRRILAQLEEWEELERQAGTSKTSVPGTASSTSTAPASKTSVPGTTSSTSTIPAGKTGVPDTASSTSTIPADAVAAAAAKMAIILGSGYGELVAGGGIISSVNIVKKICGRIRDHIEKTWPD